MLSGDSHSCVEVFHNSLTNHKEAIKYLYNSKECGYWGIKYTDSSQPARVISLETFFSPYHTRMNFLSHDSMQKVYWLQKTEQEV